MWGRGQRTDCDLYYLRLYFDVSCGSEFALSSVFVPRIDEKGNIPRLGQPWAVAAAFRPDRLIQSGGLLRGFNDIVVARGTCAVDPSEVKYKKDYCSFSFHKSQREDVDSAKTWWSSGKREVQVCNRLSNVLETG